MDSEKGWGPWRYVWLSGCSRHQRPSGDCRGCRNGGWRHAWALAFGQSVFAVAPNLWRWWANRGRR